MQLHLWQLAILTQQFFVSATKFRQIVRYFSSYSLVNTDRPIEANYRAQTCDFGNMFAYQNEQS